MSINNAIPQGQAPRKPNTLQTALTSAGIGVASGAIVGTARAIDFKPGNSVNGEVVPRDAFVSAYKTKLLGGVDASAVKENFKNFSGTIFQDHEAVDIDDANKFLEKNLKIMGVDNISGEASKSSIDRTIDDISAKVKRLWLAIENNTASIEGMRASEKPLELAYGLTGVQLADINNKKIIGLIDEQLAKDTVLPESKNGLEEFKKFVQNSGEDCYAFMIAKDTSKQEFLKLLGPENNTIDALKVTLGDNAIGKCIESLQEVTDKHTVMLNEGVEFLNKIEQSSNTIGSFKSIEDSDSTASMLKKFAVADMFSNFASDFEKNFDEKVVSKLKSSLDSSGKFKDSAEEGIKSVFQGLKQVSVAKFAAAATFVVGTATFLGMKFLGKEPEKTK